MLGRHVILYLPLTKLRTATVKSKFQMPCKLQKNDGCSKLGISLRENAFYTLFCGMPSLGVGPISNYRGVPPAAFLYSSAVYI